ncbi:MAG TPA: dihydrofolate reductase family protein [Ktedonobacterales bacterium]
MRKLVVSEFLSLDGVMEDPGGAEGSAHGGWSMPYWHEEIGQVKFDELVAADALLLGRITYEGFAAAWPGRTDEAGFADRMNGIAKYVVSTTLHDAAWSNSHIIRDDVAGQIAALKAQEGQDILVAGSGLLTQTLIANNLVDEFRLLVYPIALGEGKRLFGAGAYAPLSLIEGRAIPNGVMLLRYAPAK